MAGAVSRYAVIVGLVSVGVVIVGVVAKTLAPVPVSSVSSAARFALVGVPRNVKAPAAVVVVDGAAPAPPPMTRALAVRAAEVAQVDELEKYGMPPDVPATVKASVPLVVTGEPPTETIPPVKVCATEETVPAEAALLANSLTVPALFLKYSFSSRVLSANSPATRFAAKGAVAAVVL